MSKPKILKNLLSKISIKDHQLPSLDEILRITRSKNRVYLGVMEIEVSKIIGSEGRYADFDENFLPNNENLKFHLGQIKKLVDEGYPLPPISVFKIDDFYFVRDGNHRVAVAKQRGQIYIDAEITEYFLDVPITAKLTLSDRILIQEHSNFLETTGLVKFGRDAVINLSNPKYYTILIDIIKKYVEIQNLKAKNNLSFQDGAALWYNKVFLPFAEDAYRFDMLSRFPERTTGDLYVWLQTNWHALDSLSQTHDLSYMLGSGEGIKSDDPISLKEINILKEIYSKNLRIESNFILNHTIAIAVLSVLVYLGPDMRPKLLIVQRKYHPNEGRWSLPLSMLRVDEEFKEALNRCQRNVLGIHEPIDLTMCCVQDKKKRNQFGRSVAVCYFGLIIDHDDKYEFSAGHLAKTLKLAELEKVPKLVYDHNEVLNISRDYFQANYTDTKKFASFFPDKMPFADLIASLEAINTSFERSRSN